MTDSNGSVQVRGGSLRHKDAVTGNWVVSQPGDPLFALATMMATEYFNGETWVAIYPDDMEIA